MLDAKSKCLGSSVADGRNKKKHVILLGKYKYNPHIKHHTIKEDFQLN